MAARACAPPAPEVTPEVPAAAAPATAAWLEKLAWIVRLEDQRVLRDPSPPPPRPASPGQLAVAVPPEPSDLLVLIRDREARVRRRASLAAGRIGLPEAIPYLVERLADTEPEVAQMAAFALGLIGDPSARGALVQALESSEPLVQGRAAEALGLIGDKADAPAVGAMVQAHVRAGALNGIDVNSLEQPLAPAVETVRLGVYALARLGVYDALASAVLDPAGQPVSAWWPIAYALQRVGDARAAGPLASLMVTPGRYTASFAVRGLAAARAQSALPQLRAFVETRQADRAVLIQAIRALAALSDIASETLLAQMATDQSLDQGVREEAMAAFAALTDARAADALADLLFHPEPFVRAHATRALARVAPGALMLTLSGLDPDEDWTVRVAQAAALGALADGAGIPRLTLMLEDRDQRVVSAVMSALVAAKAPGADQILQERLSSPDVGVRAAAAQGLAELKAVGAVPALGAALQAAAADPSYVARGAVLSAIHRLDAPTARPLLEAALTDRDWALRVFAAERLRESGAAGAAAVRPATPGVPVDDPAWRALVAPPFSPHAYIDTDKGTIEIELAVLDAPLTVRNFVTLARKGFFNNVLVHRVVHDFVVQGGDPRGDGEGGPGYTIRDEINQLPYLRGTVGMALDWKDTGGSQFFITHSPAPHLDGRYTVFGRVVAGMEVVDRILPWDRIRGVRINDGVSE
ncbi:MAG TPA: HEAT repeat domain-containing protein [Vicinamibacterales bacterium]